jgi:hypothetical protein
MLKYFSIALILLLFACNQQPSINDKDAGKLNHDTLIIKEQHVVVQNNASKISPDSADVIAGRIVNSNFVEFKENTDGSRHLYDHKYKIEQVSTENGYLIAAQRNGAIFDIYLSISNGMDDDMPKGISLDSLKKHTNTFDEGSLKNAVEYLKSNSSAVVEVLEYMDLRYGQMCSIISPTRSRLVAGYIISQGINAERIVAAGFGYDEPYIMQEDDGIFKKGDTLTDKYIADLQNEKDKDRAYEILRSKQVEVIVLPGSN